MSPRAPPFPACRGAGSGSVAWPRVRAMAGGLEPHLEALRRELRGPAVLSVLIALIAVAITFRELREPPFPPAPRPAGGQRSRSLRGRWCRQPRAEVSPSPPHPPLSRSDLAVRAGQEEQPEGRAAAGSLRRGEDAAVRAGERGGGLGAARGCPAPASRTEVKEFPLARSLIF